MNARCTEALDADWIAMRICAFALYQFFYLASIQRFHFQDIFEKKSKFGKPNDRKEKGKQKAQTGSLISLWKSKQRR